MIKLNISTISIVYTLAFCALILCVVFILHFVMVFILFRWFTRIRYAEGIVVFNQCVVKEMENNAGLYELFHSSSDMTCYHEPEEDESHHINSRGGSSYDRTRAAMTNNTYPSANVVNQHPSMYPATMSIPQSLWQNSPGSYSYTHLNSLVRGGIASDNVCSPRRGENVHANAWYSAAHVSSMCYADQTVCPNRSSQNDNLENSINFCRQLPSYLVQRQTWITDAITIPALSPLSLSSVASVIKQSHREDEISRDNIGRSGRDDHVVMHPLTQRYDRTIEPMTNTPHVLNQQQEQQQKQEQQPHEAQQQRTEDNARRIMDGASTCLGKDGPTAAPSRVTQPPGRTTEWEPAPHRRRHSSHPRSLSSTAQASSELASVCEGGGGQSSVTAITVRNDSNTVEQINNSLSRIVGSRDMTNHRIDHARAAQPVANSSGDEMASAAQVAISSGPSEMGLIYTEWPTLRGFAMNFPCADAVDRRLRPHRHIAAVRKSRKQRHAKLRARYCRHFGPYNGVTFSMWGRPLSDLFDPLRLRLYAAFHTYESDEPAEGWLLCGGRSIRPVRCGGISLTAAHGSQAGYVNYLSSMQGGEAWSKGECAQWGSNDEDQRTGRRGAADAAVRMATGPLGCADSAVTEHAIHESNMEMRDIITGEQFYPVNMHIFFNPYLSGCYSNPTAPWTWGIHPCYQPRTPDAPPDIQIIYQDDAVPL